jgi:hypothetical protein
VHTDRRAIGRQLKLGVSFAPLVCPAVRDLNMNVFEVGRVAQHLEITADFCKKDASLARGAEGRKARPSAKNLLKKWLRIETIGRIFRSNFLAGQFPKLSTFRLQEVAAVAVEGNNDILRVLI